MATASAVILPILLILPILSAILPDKIVGERVERDRARNRGRHRPAASPHRDPAPDAGRRPDPGRQSGRLTPNRERERSRRQGPPRRAPREQVVPAGRERDDRDPAPGAPARRRLAL